MKIPDKRESEWIRVYLDRNRFETYYKQLLDRDSIASKWSIVNVVNGTMIL